MFIVKEFQNNEKYALWLLIARFFCFQRKTIPNFLCTSPFQFTVKILGFTIDVLTALKMFELLSIMLKIKIQSSHKCEKKRHLIYYPQLNSLECRPVSIKVYTEDPLCYFASFTNFGW